MGNGVGGGGAAVLTISLGTISVVAVGSESQRGAVKIDLDA